MLDSGNGKSDLSEVNDTFQEAIDKVENYIYPD
jgi:hypothetical protein